MFLYKVWCPILLLGGAVTILAGDPFTRRLVLALPFIGIALFLSSLASLRVRDGAVSYRRLLRWKTIPRDQIKSAQVEFPPLSSLRLTKFLFPWGRLYFILEPQQTQALDALLHSVDKKRNREYEDLDERTTIPDKLAKARSICGFFVGLFLHPLLRILLPRPSEPLQQLQQHRPTLIIIQEKIFILLGTPYVALALCLFFLSFAIFRYRDRHAWISAFLAGTSVSWLLLLLVQRS